MLCHDRRLSKCDRSNPDSEREIVRLDDRVVRLESDRFLERHAFATDHDQDQLSVWQLFDPSLDALCAAAARIFARMVEIQGHRGESASPEEGTRDDLVERELAEHPFETRRRTPGPPPRRFAAG